MKTITALSLLLICFCSYGCTSRGETVVGSQVAINKDAVPVEGRPTSAIAVTQCNLLVAVFLTMPDGRLLHFDSRSGVPHDKLLLMAYTAVRSERVEISCDSIGVKGYEKHETI